jgi:hypothetical protein
MRESTRQSVNQSDYAMTNNGTYIQPSTQQDANNKNNRLCDDLPASKPVTLSDGLPYS